MKIAVVGLGGVGGYLGGRIAQKYAGTPEHKVFFIARGAHLAAIQKKGLLLKTMDGTFPIFPDLATDRPAEVGPCDLILFCVKEYSLESAAATIDPILDEKTVVLPILNGVDISERLCSVLFRGRILSGCIYISSFIEQPGVVCHVGGSGRIVFGPDNRNIDPYRQLETLLKGAGVKAELSADIAVSLWTKYLYVSPMAGMTSLMAKPYGAVMADRNGKTMVRGLMKEILSLAHAKGIALPTDCVENAIARIELLPFEIRSSMQLDYEKRGETELELFIGYAVRAGRSYGVPMPLHDELYATLKNNISCKNV